MTSWILAEKEKLPSVWQQFFFGWYQLGIHNIIQYNLIGTGSNVIHQSYPSHHMYNFLLEGKTYIRIRRAFHWQEPSAARIHVSQWDQSCAFIWALRVRIRLTDLPPKLPPKGFGTGQHDAALLCTHGTKSISSLGTQHHQTQQNSTVTHKF